MSSNSKTWQERLIDPSELSAWAQGVRAAGLTLATLNGSFDLLHAGHLHIIAEAAKAADLLLVALNTDSSIKRYKGPHRPIIPLEYRLELMASLRDVDFVTFFEEDDPCELLKKVRPDVHVNGAEYGKECVEAATLDAIGAKLVLVDRLPSLSTSSILTKITHLIET